MTRVLAVAAGLLLITAGKRVFRLIIATAGFAVGAELTSRAMAGSSPNLIYVSAALAGTAGAVIALYAEHLFIVTAGFVMGGYAVLFIGSELFGAVHALGSAPVISGAAAGAVTALFLLGPSVIIFSVTAGAALVVFNSGVPGPRRIPAMAALIAAGLLFQLFPRGKNRKTGHFLIAGLLISVYCFSYEALAAGAARIF